MKAVTIKGFPPSAIEHIVIDAEIPKPRANEVLVKVHASSVNPKDWKFNERVFSATPALLPVKKTQILGDDLSGVIVDKGSDVNQFAIGDEIYGMNISFRTGALAEYAVIPSSCIAIKPATVSFTEAGTVPLAGLTALQLLYDAEITANNHLLIIGASGGVGVYCVQLAKAMGAEVTAVCSYRNTELVASLGADHIIDYTQEDYLKKSDAFDVVIDVTSYESIFSCHTLIKPGGIYIMTMGYYGSTLKLFAGKLLKPQWRSRSTLVKANTRDLDTLREYIEQGLVKPIIDSEYSLNETAAAYQRSKSGRASGKIAINIAHTE